MAISDKEAYSQLDLPLGECIWFVYPMILSSFLFQINMMVGCPCPNSITDVQTFPPLPPPSEIAISAWKICNVLKLIRNKFYDFCFL